MKRLNAWLRFPDNTTVLVGTLVATDPEPIHGNIKGQFRYNEDYLSSPGSFAIDPINLPLTDAIQDANRPAAGIHGVFDDALPDSWGRQLLIKRSNTSVKQCTPIVMLELLAGSGLGGLVFASESCPQPKIETSIVELTTLLKVCEEFEAGIISDKKEFQMLLDAGSSPGGARPKVLVCDEDDHWIAKFPSIRDQFDLVTLEAASMKLAKLAGVNVADTVMRQYGNKNVLLVRRFDTTKQGGRRHMISLKTLLQAEGYYFKSYSDIADCVKKISYQPLIDLENLYRHMVFNVVIGNRDDHLQNFTMLHDNNGWYLSPAYDLLPNIASLFEHALLFRYDSIAPPYNDLIKLYQLFGLKHNGRAEEIIQNTVEVISNCQNVFTEFNVSKQDQKRILPGIMSLVSRYNQ